MRVFPPASVPEGFVASGNLGEAKDGDKVMFIRTPTAEVEAEYELPSGTLADPPVVETAKEEYERLLATLEQLIADGKGDSDEADEVRDEMDAPWYQMKTDNANDFAGFADAVEAEFGTPDPGSL